MAISSVEVSPPMLEAFAFLSYCSRVLIYRQSPRPSALPCVGGLFLGGGPLGVAGFWGPSALSGVAKDVRGQRDQIGVGVHRVTLDVYVRAVTLSERFRPERDADYVADDQGGLLSRVAIFAILVRDLSRDFAQVSLNAASDFGD
jgi:hypothetical protein